MLWTLWTVVFATFAMARGTAITVSALAAIAVGSREWAARLGGDSDRWATTVAASAGIAGSGLVFAMGSAFFMASLSGPAPLQSRPGKKAGAAPAARTFHNTRRFNQLFISAANCDGAQLALSGGAISEPARHSSSVMSRLLFAICLSVAVLGLTVAARAAPDLETVALPDSTGLEIIVIEVDGCLYCDVIRRDVLPAYQISGRSKLAPMRFIDINAPDVDRLSLKSPINTVPTVLILENGRELERIPGYVGREVFFNVVNRFLPMQP